VAILTAMPCLLRAWGALPGSVRCNSLSAPSIAVTVAGARSPLALVVPLPNARSFPKRTRAEKICQEQGFNRVAAFLLEWLAVSFLNLICGRLPTLCWLSRRRAWAGRGTGVYTRLTTTASGSARAWARGIGESSGGRCPGPAICRAAAVAAIVRACVRACVCACVLLKTTTIVRQMQLRP
jgi:hypothetical protein